MENELKRLQETLKNAQKTTDAMNKATSADGWVELSEENGRLWNTATRQAESLIDTHGSEAFKVMLGFEGIEHLFLRYKVQRAASNREVTNELMELIRREPETMIYQSISSWGAGAFPWLNGSQSDEIFELALKHGAEAQSRENIAYTTALWELYQLPELSRENMLTLTKTLAELKGSLREMIYFRLERDTDRQAASFIKRCWPKFYNQQLRNNGIDPQVAETLVSSWAGSFDEFLVAAGALGPEK